MSIARINGPMLTSNLERQGINLAIDSSVAYFDVNNRRLGVNNSAPNYTLDVTGNAHLGNLYILGNVISTDPGYKLNLGSITNLTISGGAVDSIVYTDGQGNLNFGNLATLASLEGFSANSMPLGTNAQGSFSNAISISTTTTITDAIALLNQNQGNITASVVSLQNGAYSNANVASYLPIYSGNVSANAVTASLVTARLYGNLSADTISPYQTTSTVFNSNTAIGLPSGNTASRPASPVPGYLRYNTDYNGMEVYSNSSWVPIGNEITSQVINCDGINSVFTLNQASSQDGILVSINGTVQTPGAAYTISANQITFSQVPASSDVVDVRFLATTVSFGASVTGNLSVSGNLTLGGLLTAPQVTVLDNSPGTAGEIAWDANYIYVCTATNTWKRVALTSF
jgi:hypothetical protein